MVYIYRNTGEFIHSLNYTYEEFMEKKDQVIDGYKIYDWTDDLIASKVLYAFPIVDKITGELREMTEKEKIENGKYELKDGEYFDGNKVITVPKPVDMLKPSWNKELLIWEETATPNDIQLDIYIKQLKFIDVEIADTDFFDWRAHRKMVEANGDPIAEMDEYRDSLLVLKTDIQQAVDQLKNPTRRTKRSLSFATYAEAKAELDIKLERPSWSSKYKAS